MRARALEPFSAAAGDLGAVPSGEDRIGQLLCDHSVFHAHVAGAGLDLRGLFDGARGRLREAGVKRCQCQAIAGLYHLL